MTEPPSEECRALRASTVLLFRPSKVAVARRVRGCMPSVSSGSCARFERRDTACRGSRGSHMRPDQPLQKAMS